MKLLLTFIAITFLATNYSSSADFSEFLRVKPRSGDAVLDLLSRYELDYSKNIGTFQEMNAGKFTSNGGLLLHNKYQLPIAILKYDGKSIRSTIGITDFSLAEKIQKYNLALWKSKIKKGNYQSDRILWVPYLDYNINFTQEVLTTKSEKADKAEKNDVFKPIIIPQSKYSTKSTISLFGEKFINVRKIDNSLKNHFFYLISGHGGPDPGAIGYRDGNELHEHEYAYDVTLRLAKRLIESGAEVMMIVQDPLDGIRDDYYLSNASEEYLITGDTISANQLLRLKQRTDIVNNLYSRNNKAGTEHLVIEIHVDSRITDKRIDIFFYHQPNSNAGEKCCKTLLGTIKDKYEKNQPGRGYMGSVSGRNLYTLRNSKPVGVYIELGNIQNPTDQVRLIDPNNRQAIANWLLDGVVNYYSKTK